MLKPMIFLACLTFCLTMQTGMAHAATTKFKNIPTMMNTLAEYSEEMGTFSPGKKDQTRFELHPVVDENDPEEIVVLRAKQAIIWTVYRVFIHTPINQVSVKSTPKIYKDENWKPLSKYSQTLTITREKALAALGDLLNVNSFNELVLDDTWSTLYDQIAIEDQEPGPEKTFAILLEKSRDK